MPHQLRSDELSQEIRAQLWAIFYDWLESGSEYGDLAGTRNAFVKAWHVNGLHLPLDEFSPDLGIVARTLKKMFFAPDFFPLFDLIEFALSSGFFASERKAVIGRIFERGRAGWRVSGQLLVPFATQEEADAAGQSLKEIEASGNMGVRAHLANSAQALSAGRWADSARESISAVEAAGRAYDDKKTLGQVVRLLRTQGKPIHPALASGLAALYGYASDEKGIRHSLVDDDKAAVGESEALLMYGLSVAFAQYLVRSHKAD